jgi:hypothetical protein
MGSFDDVYQVNCSGSISYKVGDETLTGFIMMPCGADHDTKVVDTIQLPYKYQIYRERARLAPCCYWREDTDPEDLDSTVPSSNSELDPGVYEFINVLTTTGVLPQIEITTTGGVTETIDDPDLNVVGGWAHETSPSFIVSPRTLFPILINGATSIPTKCKRVGADIWNQGQDATPPCNGAKTECPFYTGPSFKYIKDEHMAPGQPVLGQMVQELRSLILDWKNLEDGQQQWEESFSIPYIWGRDFDDQPTAVATENYEPGPIEEIPVYTVLTKIFWDVEQGDAVLSKVPGETSGTDQSNTGDILSPPDFPTIVNELGSAEISPIKITFPKVKENTVFDYTVFDKEGSSIYLAGLSTAVNNIYIVNRTLMQDCPDIEALDLNDPEQTQGLSDFIVKNVIKSLSLKITGFAYTTADPSRFWEVRSGIDLKAKAENKIYVLTQNSNKWRYEKVVVRFRLAHCEVIQQGHSGIVPLPQTRSLKERIVNLNTQDSILFNAVPLLEDEIEISKVYHFYIFDRGYSRFLKEVNPPPNTRFWKVTKTTKVAIGSGLDETGGLKWSKFDNCNRYLVEILNPVLSAAIPMGINRSWEPKSILFTVAQEPGTSSHGEQQDTLVEMKVVEDFGRSYNGNLMPVRFMIVEPKEDIDLKTPDPKSSMEVTLDVFEALNASEEGDDVLSELLEDFKDDNFPKEAGGVALTAPSEDDKLASSDTHSFSKTKQSFSVGAVQKYDMSYVVEFALKSEDGKTPTVIGRKWVYGVGDIYDCWSRDVDISYAWLDNHQFRKINPDYFRKRVDLIDGSTYPSNVLEGWSGLSHLYESKYTVYRPKCGDHEVTFGKPGPMFSPYEDCEPPFTEINDLSIRVSYRPRIDSGGGLIVPDNVDEKYRGPDLYHPLVYKHNVLFYLEFPCIYEFSLGHYIRTGSARWAGFSRIRGPISAEFNPIKYLFYQSNGWQLPKFGNIGRDRIRVFRTMHYREYIYMLGSQPTVAQGWMPGFPFIGSNSIFNTNLPRTFYDQAVESSSVVSSLDYSDFSNLETIMQLSTPGSEPENGIGQPTEGFYNERKKFDDVYKVKKIRTTDGKGTRFPEQGFYFNFRSKDVVWAFPEQPSDLTRNKQNYSENYIDSLNFIGGTSFLNPKAPDGATLVDRFNRPIHLSLPEGKHNIKIKEQVFDEEGVLITYASIYVKEEYPVYFDRFTGEIKDVPGPTPIDGATNPLYPVQSLGELQDYIEESESFSFQVTPVFEFINDAEADTAPESSEDLTKLSEFINYGNLYIDLTELKIFALTPEEGPLSNEEIPWVGFFPSINVERIIPKYLPKVEVPLEDDIKTLLNFSSYPGTDWQDREPKSGVDLDNADEALIVSNGGDIPSEDKFHWKAYDSADKLLDDPIVDGHDIRHGQIGGFTIQIKFDRPVELSFLKMAYKVYGSIDTDATDFTSGELVPFDVDPSFKILVHSYLTSEIISLVEKPQFNYKNNSLKSVTRSFNFYVRGEEEEPQNSTSDSNINTSTKIDPIVTDTIEIQVGSRSPLTAINLSEVSLKHLLLNEQTSEEFGVLEPQFMITTGLHLEGNPLGRAAQDPNRVTGIVSTPDTSDALEYQGIAELWKPQDFSEVEVKTIGKLRREWANKFLTHDTIRYFDPALGAESDVVFFDSSVEDSEKRQLTLIEALRDIFELYPQLEKMEYKFLLTPQDRFILQSLGSNTQKLDALFKIIFKAKLFSLENLSLVSKSENIKGGTLATPWQDKGFRACVGEKYETKGCFGVREPSAIGGRGPHLITDSEHTVCNQRLFEEAGFYGSRLGSFDLFEVVGLDGAASLLATEAARDRDRFSELAFENAAGGSTQTKINRYREELAKKKLGYQS